MLRRRERKQQRVEAVQYRYTVACCSGEFTWPGRLPEDRQYICKKCGKEMSGSEQKLMTRDAALLIINNQKRFKDNCPHCKGARHRVERNDEAWFLVCEICNTGIRELREEELS